MSHLCAALVFILMTGLLHNVTPLATLLAFVNSPPIPKKECTCIFSKALQDPHDLCGLVSVAHRRKYTCVLFLLHNKKSQTPSKRPGVLHYATPLLFYFIGKFFELPYEIKKRPKGRTL